MRILILSAAVAASLFSLSGCQGNDNPNSPALQAMDNPPNACGPGGSRDIEDCENSR